MEGIKIENCVKVEKSLDEILFYTDDQEACFDEIREKNKALKFVYRVYKDGLFVLAYKIDIA